MASKPPKQPTQKPPPKLPTNWPSHLTYLTTPLYTLTTPQRRALQTQPPTGPPLPEIPPTLPFSPSPLVLIQRITNPAHPAAGQHGLFARRRLPPGSFICPYWGVYHAGTGARSARHAASDYDLWLDRGGVVDVAVDAARAGCEARFVNDFRGVPGLRAARANAEFRECWDPRRGERAMAVFVVAGGGGRRRGTGAVQRGGGGIAEGEEIVVSYGKGFWEVREEEARKKNGGGKGADKVEEGKEKEAPSVGGDEDVGKVADALGSLKVADHRSAGGKGG